MIKLNTATIICDKCGYTEEVENCTDEYDIRRHMVRSTNWFDHTLTDRFVLCNGRCKNEYLKIKRKHNKEIQKWIKK